MRRQAAAMGDHTSAVRANTAADIGEQPRRGWFWLRLSPDHRRWRDRRRRRRLFRVRFQPNAGALREEGFGVTGKFAAPRPSVVGSSGLSATT